MDNVRSEIEEILRSAFRELKDEISVELRSARMELRSARMKLLADLEELGSTLGEIDRMIEQMEEAGKRRMEELSAPKVKKCPSPICRCNWDQFDEEREAEKCPSPVCPCNEGAEGFEAAREAQQKALNRWIREPSS